MLNKTKEQDDKCVLTTCDIDTNLPFALEVDVGGEDSNIRSDIINSDVANACPLLPKTRNWKCHRKFVKKRHHYLMVRDAIAYQNLMNTHQIDFKPSNVVNIKIKHCEIFCIFVENFVRLVRQKKLTTSPERTLQHTI